MTRVHRWTIWAAASALLLAGPARADGPPTDEQARFFESKVRPLLAENCAKCHGESKQKGGLRLDSRAAMLEGGDAGPAVVPGKPGESVLILAVKHEGEGPKMPPSKKLAADQVDVLARWVAMGAPWPGGDAAPAAASTGPTTRKGPFQITDEDRKHWAFVPLRRPAVPAIPDASNPVDAFIRAGLDARGLRANPPASRLELIRRATYDLTGLPPAPAEVDAFLADASPLAYEDLVDRLLASPHYGEKWGRHWLDLVRFAETNSYERDGAKPNAWRYRDYVIRSFNDDKPYDRFVREQLAGDEMPGTDFDRLIATGFYRLGIWDDEPSDREQARYDGFDDLVATTSQVFLGLTVDCARCHDHKLDPIPQKDYYRLLAYFRNVNHFRNGGPTDEAPLIGDDDRRDYENRVAERAQHLAGIQSEIDAIEAEFRASDPEAARAGLVDIENLTYRYYRDTFDRLPDFAALKPEDTGDLPRGRFDLAPRTRDEAFGFVFEGTLVVPKAGAYTFTLDSDDGSRLTVAGRVAAERDGVHGQGKPRVATVELAEGRQPIKLEYFQQGHGLGLTVSWSGPGLPTRLLSSPGRPEPASKDFAALIKARGEEVLGQERFDRYRKLRRDQRVLQSKPVAAASALCVTEAGPKAPETTVLLRGNPTSPGDAVEPALPVVLGLPAPSFATPAPGAKTTGRRTVLAGGIASADNPLTARVMANRVWQYHFGRGIVRSPNNFGRQGDKPTHVELLDWLASELISGGWTLKPLHRLIMTSNAYRMSSRADAASLAKDPVNDGFWRFDMRRLDAEEIRDSILAVSGKLNPKMYGPGVYPEIPREVMAGQSMPGAGWGKSTPEEQARRSIYVHVKRSLMVPILESFDAAETDRSTPSRFSTTQPTQALGMINGSFIRREAAALAARLRREAGAEPAKQVAFALKLVTSRSPEPAEVDRGLALIDGLKSRDGLDADASLEAFCLVALNLNEFIDLD